MGRPGAHVSVAGGAPAAVERARELGCDAFQIFVKSPNRWSAKERPAAESDAFRKGREGVGLPVVAHAGYLINLASPKPEVRDKSADALLDELRRCEALGVPGLVLHPGAPQNDGREIGIDRVAQGLDAVLERLGPASVRVLLENTAGQGSTLGVDLAEIEAIRARSAVPDRLGVCLDTCHAFAAGYDLRDASGYERLIDELADGSGTGTLACWHLNDSKFPLGARRDRHANIGDGELGREPFARLLHDDRFAELPMILETPLGDDELGHARDLATLRAL
ncbi:MAG: deoxyribonuclease IV [Trueperaceae bacterium]